MKTLKNMLEYHKVLTYTPVLLIIILCLYYSINISRSREPSIVENLYLRKNIDDLECVPTRSQVSFDHYGRPSSVFFIENKEIHHFTGQRINDTYISDRVLDVYFVLLTRRDNSRSIRISIVGVNSKGEYLVESLSRKEREVLDFFSYNRI